MKIQAVKTRIFKEREDLAKFIVEHLGRVKERSILVVTSKIIALSEGRTAPFKSHRAKTKLIRAESQIALRAKPVWLTIKDGMFMASAGIDESNANGKLVLLPKDSFAAAEELYKKLRRKFGVKHFGILVTDSRTTPLRSGVVGAALGYAGFCGIKDYRGALDIFGRKFKFSRVNVADSLAAAAVLVMGEGRERQPLAVIEDPPVKFCAAIRRKELQIDIRDDMYRPLFKELLKRRR